MRITQIWRLISKSDVRYANYQMFDIWQYKRRESIFEDRQIDFWIVFKTILNVFESILDIYIVKYSKVVKISK